MSLYDRDYMRDGRTGIGGTDRNPGNLRRTAVSASNRLGRGEQVGFVIAAVGVIALLIGLVIL